MLEDINLRVWESLLREKQEEAELYKKALENIWNTIKDRVGTRFTTGTCYPGTDIPNNLPVIVSSIFILYGEAFNNISEASGKAIRGITLIDEAQP